LPSPIKNVIMTKKVMKKIPSSLHGIAFIAATAIGSGIVALPLTLAQIGIVPSIVLMLITWFFIYYTSLVNFELNLQAGEGLGLSKLSELFAGKKTSLVAFLVLEALFLTLLAAYITGSNNLLQSRFLISNQALLPLVIFIILVLPSKLVSSINSSLFLGMMAVVALLLINLIIQVEWKGINWFGPKAFEISGYKTALPIIFTSFGFQVIFHTITNYYYKEAKVIHKVALIGSFIPALVYIIWNTSLLVALQKAFPDFYISLTNGSVSLDQLIEQLALLSPTNEVRAIIWWITFLAIITSVIGAGLGLVQSFDPYLSSIKSGISRRFIATSVTIIPSFLISIMLPNAFLKVLAFAGILLVLIAILIPLYLLFIIKDKEFYFKSLKNPGLIALSWFFGFLILFFGIK